MYATRISSFQSVISPVHPFLRSKLNLVNRGIPNNAIVLKVKPLWKGRQSFHSYLQTRSLRKEEKTEENKTEEITPKPAPKEKEEEFNARYARPVTWKALILVGIVGAIGLFIFSELKRRKDEERMRKQKESIGTPRIGGPFTLVDQNGKPVTDGLFKGKFMLVYFGFTHCPDICPTELKKMSRVLSTIDHEGVGQLVQPVFISVDPLRDTVRKVRDYVKEFHPRLVGLTGTPEQVRDVCKVYRVYFSKAREEQGYKDDDDYVLDHSIFFYLMDTNGKILDYYGTDLTEEVITKRISQHLRDYVDQASGPKKVNPWWKIF